MFYVVWSHFDPCDCNSPFASSKSLLLLVLLCPDTTHTSRRCLFDVKSNQFYCHITTARVPWWVKFLRACSRQCRNNLYIDSTYLQSYTEDNVQNTHTYTQYTHSVVLDILTVINKHYAPYVHILHYVHIYTHSNMRRCNRLYISFVSWMCIRTRGFCAFVQCVRVVQLNCVKVKVQCMAYHKVGVCCSVSAFTSARLIFFRVFAHLQYVYTV